MTMNEQPAESDAVPHGPDKPCEPKCHGYGIGCPCNPRFAENDPRVPVLAALLEADFGWAVDAGWTATAASMLAKMDAATREHSAH